MNNPCRIRLPVPLMVAALLGAVTALSGCHSPTGTDPASPDSASSKSATDRQSLFDGQSLGDWQIASFGGQDEVRVEQGEIRIAMGYPLAGFVYTGEDFPDDDYLLELEAQKVQGTDFFCCLTFPVRDQFCSLVVGGWGGTVTGISCIDGRDASDNATRTLRKYHPNQWYHIQVRVAGNRLVCRIDGEPVVDLDRSGIELSLRTEVLPCRPLGICSFSTEAACRNIFVTRLDDAKSVARDPGN